MPADCEIDSAKSRDFRRSAPSCFLLNKYVLSYIKSQLYVKRICTQWFGDDFVSDLSDP